MYFRNLYSEFSLNLYGNVCVSNFHFWMGEFCCDFSFQNVNGDFSVCLMGIYNNKILVKTLKF